MVVIFAGCYTRIQNEEQQNAAVATLLGIIGWICVSDPSNVTNLPANCAVRFQYIASDDDDGIPTCGELKEGIEGQVRDEAPMIIR